jgi:hypothetical protein
MEELSDHIFGGGRVDTSSIYRLEISDREEVTSEATAKKN